MKKRIIKKWIKRHIMPLIKDLPRTQAYSTAIPIGEGRFVLASRQQEIINGRRTPAGVQINHYHSIKNAILITAGVIEQLKLSKEHIFVRVDPVMRGKRLYVRLITD